MKIQTNLSLTDSALRYVIMMVFPIVGGLYESIFIMLLCMPFMLTAITGYCPLYQFLGINNSGKESPFALDETAPATKQAELKHEVATAA